MGKKQHQSDKLYLTTKEWINEYGGKKAGVFSSALRALGFDCCTLTLQQPENPVIDNDGYHNELSAINPFLRRHGVSPVTGQPMSSATLSKVHFHRDDEGNIICPVGLKPFNDHSHIVCIKKTGNVFSFETVDSFNVKVYLYEFD